MCVYDMPGHVLSLKQNMNADQVVSTFVSTAHFEMMHPIDVVIYVIESQKQRIEPYFLIDFLLCLFPDLSPECFYLVVSHCDHEEIKDEHRD